MFIFVRHTFIMATESGTNVVLMMILISVENVNASDVKNYNVHFQL